MVLEIQQILTYTHTYNKALAKVTLHFVKSLARHVYISCHGFNLLPFP